MNNKQMHNKFRWIALIFVVLFSNVSADAIINLLLIEYGGLGNIVSSDTVTPKVFRSFQAWDRYIDLNMFADTRNLPEIAELPFWKNDSFYFENSIAIAFEGNRIATILDVVSSGGKIIVKYKLSEGEYTITDYQFDPQGREFEATAIVFYILRSATMDLKEKEVVFELKNVSVKKPHPITADHSMKNKVFQTKKVDISGRSLSESKTCGIYLMKSAGNTLRKIEIK